MDGKEVRRKIIFWERQIEGSEGHYAYKENPIMNCFVLFCCKKIPLGLQILDEERNGPYYPPWIKKNW